MQTKEIKENFGVQLLKIGPHILNRHLYNVPITLLFSLLKRRK